ncbi:MAG: DUF4367 domain-containing protein [Lachnospiraceae bacterium]|nr:DUF4367 domain-containing protein [Lachnospiraceae bacterium]
MSKIDDIFNKNVEIPDIVIKKANLAFNQIKEEDFNMKKHSIIKKKTNIWKVSAAVCAVTILIPTVAFASTKIYQYYNTSVSKEDKKVEMVLEGNNTEAGNKYIKLSADFGQDYSICKEGALMHYEYVEGFEAGRNFWYELIKLDNEEMHNISTYDNETVEELKINGRKAVYCKKNYIEGSRYETENGTIKDKTLYIFLEDCGYFIRMTSQKNLSKEEFIALAEKIQITEVDSKENASQYFMYSDALKPDWELGADDLGLGVKEEVDLSNYHDDSTIDTCGGTVTVESVEILDSVNDLDLSCFIEEVEMNQFWDEEGNLKAYDREVLEFGNGIDSPYCKVVDTVTINPKLVYVTLRYEGVEALFDNVLQVPKLDLVDGEKMYVAGTNYNRPKDMDKIVCNGFPCYFEETKGGESFYFADLNDGSVTMHIGYLVDEDMVGGMLLDIESWDGMNAPVYIDISQ